MNRATRLLITGFLCYFAATSVFAGQKKQGTPEVEMSLEISPVWSGHPVGFFLLTKRNHQYVAFYDQERRMTVAMRTLDSNEWHYYKFPSSQNTSPEYKASVTSTILGWDSHNYITMAIDAEGYIHLSGNMHCNALLYFRTSRPYDIYSFKQIPQMIGSQEKRCTYPRFFRGPNEEFIFIRI